MTKHKTGVMLVFGLAIVLWGAVAVKQVGSESNGTVSPKKIVPIQSAPQSAKRLQITDKLATFSYDSSYERIVAEDVALPIAARYNFIKHEQFNSLQIAVTITRLQSGALSDDGTYNFRYKTPARFSKQERSIAGRPATIFTDMTSEVFSKVVYVRTADYSASIAMSSSTVTDTTSLQAELDALTASWRWR